MTFQIHSYNNTVSEMFGMNPSYPVWSPPCSPGTLQLRHPSGLVERQPVPRHQLRRLRDPLLYVLLPLVSRSCFKDRQDVKVTFCFFSSGEASSGKHVTNMDIVRNVDWATSTCTLGFNTFGRSIKLTWHFSIHLWFDHLKHVWYLSLSVPVPLSLSLSGIWPDGADGTDINAVCRSHDGSLLASADDFGKVHLFSFPCSQPRVSRVHSQLRTVSVRFYALVSFSTDIFMTWSYPAALPSTVF